MDWMPEDHQPSEEEDETSRNMIFIDEMDDDSCYLLEPNIQIDSLESSNSIYLLDRAIDGEPETSEPDRDHGQTDPLAEPQVSITPCVRSPRRRVRTKGSAKSHDKAPAESKNELTYACIACPAKFKQERHLENHLNKHTGEKLYTCRVCATKFAQKSSLTLHMKSHNEEKPFKCSYCEASFRLKLYLQCHERRHTGERPYACYECGSAFTQKSALNTHLKSHLDERPFACPECPATFKLRTYLKTHRKLIHSGEKPENGKRRKFAPREGNS